MNVKTEPAESGDTPSTAPKFVLAGMGSAAKAASTSEVLEKLEDAAALELDASDALLELEPFEALLESEALPVVDPAESPAAVLGAAAVDEVAEESSGAARALIDMPAMPSTSATTAVHTTTRMRFSLAIFGTALPLTAT